MERFNIVNTARAQHTRQLRNSSPGKALMKQHVGGELRVLRARPLQVSKETLVKHLEELKKKQKMGHLEVRSMDGRLVNLEDLTAGPAVPSVPAPQFALDSAKNDKNTNVGEHLPQFPGGIPVGAVAASAEGAGIPGTLESELAQSEEGSSEEEPVEAEEELASDVELSDPAATPKKKKKGNR
jgi:hypothetical protein